MLRRPFSRRRTASASPLLPPSAAPASAQPTGTDPAATPDSPADAAGVQVAVVIAMPNPHRPHIAPTAFPGSTKGKERKLFADDSAEDDDDDEGVPDIVLGVAQLPCPGWAATPGL
ncbi:uncharacterized protein FIBRA_08726 [Fibroporia radiculosa]|uniref:Uncharacterized protein n=1 Tax=Fibroporia radiculosa TaxID=599839 RepID=J4ICI3_9APHY|nr:uncharacterized protein FIBRA_08726 [Fibroporia radiculosa]CCM06461.1 predicted protein [Fibroporia radiculosa]